MLLTSQSRALGALVIATCETQSPYYAGAVGKGAADEDAADLVPEDRWGATYATQFQVLLSRAVRVRRFQAFSIQVSPLTRPACVCSMHSLFLWRGTISLTQSRQVSSAGDELQRGFTQLDRFFYGVA